MCNTEKEYYSCRHHVCDLIRCEAELEPDHSAPIPKKHDLDVECAVCLELSPEEKVSEHYQWLVFLRKDAAFTRHKDRLQTLLQAQIMFHSRQAWSANYKLRLPDASAPEQGRCVVCKHTILAGELCNDHAHLGGKEF